MSIPEPPKTKTVAIRDMQLHKDLTALTKDKGFATIEESIKFLRDFYITRTGTH